MTKTTIDITNMQPLEYNFYAPDDMFVNSNDGTPMKVSVLIEILSEQGIHSNIPQRIAIVADEKALDGGVIIYGQREDGSWYYNWNVSRPLANIFLQVVKMQDDMADFVSSSSEVAEAYLRWVGKDPERIVKDGLEFVAKLQKEAERRHGDGC